MCCLTKLVQGSEGERHHTNLNIFIRTT